MATASLDDALALCTPEELAGFAAHLAVLAGPGAELAPGLLASLDDFFRIAGLEAGQSPAERQRRFDLFFEAWPLPAALVNLLEVTSHSLERGRSALAVARRPPGVPLLGDVRTREHVVSRVTDPGELFGGGD